MKKTLTLVLCLCLVLSLFAGCGSKTPEPAKPADNGPAQSSGTPSSTPSAPSAATPAPAVSGSTSSSGEVKQAAAYKDTFIIGGLTGATGIDPQTYSSDYYGAQLVYDPLLTNKDGVFESALATSWEHPDDYTYVFKLRDGVTFQDGSKFTADDVVYTFGERMLEVPGNTTAGKLKCIEKVEAVDDLTVKFTLNSLNQDFLLFMAQPYSAIFSRKACASGENGFWIGTGPWKISNFVPGIKIEYERYDGFWGELPKPTKMAYVCYPEDAARLVAVQSGEVDCALTVSGANEEIENDKTIRGVKVRDVGVFMCCFNTKDPICGDLNFRKAVAYAIDYQELIDAAGADSVEPVSTFWGYGSYGENKDLKGYHYDLEKAKEYIAKSNYDGSTISIMCFIPTNVLNATVIVERLADIGVNAVVDERDFMGIITNTSFANPQHQMLCFNSSFGVSPDDAVRAVFYTGGSSNRAVHSNPEIDALIDAALVEPDDAKRVSMYQEIQKYNEDNVLYIPLDRSMYFCVEGLNASGIVWSSRNAYHNFRYACVAIP